jgi:hypothetical protein
MFRGQFGRQICEVREVGKYLEVRIFREPGGLGGLMYRHYPLAGNEYTLQLHVDCVSYHSGDYRIGRLVHSITVVLHVVQTHINIGI